MLTAASFTTAKSREQPKSSNGRMDIDLHINTYIHTYMNMYLYKMEYYSAIKNMEILPLATTQMGPEGIMLSGMSQAGKDKHHMISLICGI